MILHGLAGASAGGSGGENVIFANNLRSPDQLRRRLSASRGHLRAVQDARCAIWEHVHSSPCMLHAASGDPLIHILAHASVALYRAAATRDKRASAILVQWTVSSHGS